MAGPLRFFAKFLFRSRTRRHEQRARRYTVTNPFHAVSIQAPAGACQAAQQCAKKRFLSTEAPALPLAACDAANCRCRYLHHEDRREGPRRISDVAQRHNDFYRGQERRRDGGRRVTDL